MFKSYIWLGHRTSETRTHDLSPDYEVNALPLAYLDSVKA